MFGNYPSLSLTTTISLTSNYHPYIRFIREVSRIRTALDFPHHKTKQTSTKMLHNLIAGDAKSG